MINIILSTVSCKFKSIQYPDGTNVNVLLGILDESGQDCYLQCNGRILDVDDLLKDGFVYHAVPRLVGGKGGFGSMLRALGSQIQKTTNNEACRDLSGRRMRDVNNETKLKEWVDGKADREKERVKKEEERREKRQAFLRGEKHMFDDPDYHKQKNQVHEGLEDALQMGLASASTSGAQKRKSPNSDNPKKTKRACERFGLEDMSDLSDSDTSDQEYGDSNEEQGQNKDSDKQQSPGPSPGSSKEGMDVAEPLPEEIDSSSKPSDNKASLKSPAATVTSSSTLQTEEVQQQSDTNTSSSTETQEEQIVDLMTYNNSSELEPLGLDRLKMLLKEKGMKCGGTLEQRAQRLWAVRGKDVIAPELLATAKGKK